MVKKRVAELADRVLAGLDRTGVEHPVAYKLAELIRGRVGMFQERFTGV